MRKNFLRLSHILLIGVLLGTSLPVGSRPAAGAVDKPMLLGFATGPEWRQDLPNFIAETGRPAAIYQLFWGVEIDWSAGFVANILTELEALGFAPYIEVTTQNLGALNRGAQDAKLREMAGVLAGWLKGKPGRHMLIAPLPEMNNATTHPWAGDPNGYKNGYRRIRDTLLGEGLSPQQIRFVFAPNGVSNAGFYEDYYPGDRIVDVIGFAKINNGNPWRDYQVTFQMHIDQLRTQVSVTKPILITQTASVASGANGESRDQWLDDMFTRLKAHDQVIGAIYFNRDKNFDFRVLAGGQLDPAFRQGYQGWSPPSEVAWIFDGRMDSWVQEREQRFGGQFLDIRGHTFEDAIAWLAAEGITKGCNPPLNTRFCPDASVTRGEMAVFLVRATGLPASSRDYFTDDNGMFYESAVNRLYEAGITQGCGRRVFCGDHKITRGEMAAFLARAYDLPRTGKDFFVDDVNSIFQRAINRVAKREDHPRLQPAHQ